MPCPQCGEKNALRAHAHFVRRDEIDFYYCENCGREWFPMVAEVRGKTVFVNGVEIGTAKLECDAQFTAHLINDAGGDPEKLRWWDERLVSVLKDVIVEHPM